MQIVINLSKEDYLMYSHDEWNLPLELVDALQEGIILPKNHGDLIDRNELEPDTEWDDWNDDFVSFSSRQIYDAKAIIKADNEEN